MDKQRLLIADTSPVFAQELICRLQDSFQILSCADGYRAAEALEAFRPQVLVVDLMLQGLDGLTLVEQLRSAALRPKILVTTRFLTGYIEEMIHKIPFDYIMTKPCDYGVLAGRICELSATRGRGILLPGERGPVAEMLTALNISINHKGFAYLRYGIERFRSQPGMSMTGELYPAIARRFDVRPAAVEHDIRRAIDAAWRNGNRAIWRMYFPTAARPTNTLFIATLSSHLHHLHQAL